MSNRASLLLVPLTVIAIAGCATGPAAKSSAEIATAPPAPGLDCHMHVPALDAGDADAAAVIAALDEAGLGRGCLLAHGGHVAPGCEDRSCEGQRAFTTRQNDAVLTLAARAEGRLLPFCGIPVTAPFAAEEVERCAANGALGLKLHLVNERMSLVKPADPADTARLEAVFATAARHGLPLLVHLAMQDGEEVRAFFALVRRHPSVPVIAAHQLAPSLALLPEAPSNLWLEVSGLTHAPVEAGAAFVPAWRAFGMDRILLGSDWPQLSPAAHVALLKQYPLSEDERSQLVHGNGARLFGARRAQQ